MSEFIWHDVDSGEGSFGNGEDLEKTASTGLWDIAKIQQDTYYAGTNTKQEAVEVERHIRGFIESSVPYSYMENTLIDDGYSLKAIRQAFRKITGMDPAIYIDNQKVLDTPSGIPGINYGWGVSKDKNHDWYFIMPWNLSFCVFGQKGDIDRREISLHDDLNAARIALEKLVAEALYFDAPMKVDKILPPQFSDLGEPFNQVKTASDLNAQFQDGKITLKQYVTAAKHMGLATDDDFFNSIKKTAAPEVKDLALNGDIDVSELVDEELNKLEDAERVTPVEEAIKQKSPTDFFVSKVKDAPNMSTPAILEKVFQKIDSINRVLSSFKLSVKTIKYEYISIEDRLDSNVEMETQQAASALANSGIIVLIVNVINQSLPRGINSKPGMIIFAVRGKDIILNEIVKGIDNKEYAITEDGLSAYFKDVMGELQ